DAGRAAALAAELGAALAEPADILASSVDVLCPCAIGGVITVESAERMRAWAVCGAANNIVASAEAERCMLARGILHVPDVVASAGGAVDGVGLMVMGLADRIPLIDRLGETARELLLESRRTGRTPGELA